MPLLNWRSQPEQPSVSHHGWDEYPVHLMDGCKLNHKVLGWTMRFNDVLDADKLHASLTGLLSIGDWRKLGGRLKRNKNGNLKIYVPKQFSPLVPAVEYKHDESRCSQHIGAEFISSTTAPSIQPLGRELRRFMAPDDYPDTVDGLVQTDKSQLSLMVTSFADATLVSVAFPHTLLDTVSFMHLVENWSLVLAGRESKVPPLLDAYTDVLDEVAASAKDECRMESMRTRGFAFWKLLARQAAEAAHRRRRLQALYIPKDTYEKLLSRLGEGGASGGVESQPDEDELLTAWLIRTISRQEPSRPVTLITLYNLRHHVRLLKQACKKGVFAQIMVSSTCAIFPPHASTKSVKEIATDYKAQVAQLSAEGEAIAYLKQIRGELNGEKPSFALYGSTDALVVFCQPLARLDLVRVADFGPAVANKGDGRGATPPGRLVSNVFNPLDWTDAGVDLLFPLGTDHDGGCWVVAKLSSGSWDIVADELGELSRDN